MRETAQSGLVLCQSADNTHALVAREQVQGGGPRVQFRSDPAAFLCFDDSTFKCRLDLVET